MNKELSHLTKEEINELIKKYYSKTEKVKDLKKEYNIQTTKSLYSLFPPFPSKETCPYCNKNLIIQYESREYDYFLKSPVCPDCKHTKDSFCRCSNCRKKEQRIIEEEKQKQRDYIYNYLKYNILNSIDFNNLSFEDKIYLGALLREGISEDYNYIKPLNKFINPLAPTKQYAFEIIRQLKCKNILRIHPDSSFECFCEIDVETNNFSYYIDKVKWSININKENTNKVPLIESIITPSYEDLNYIEAYELWKKIALYEVLEYFNHSIKNLLNIDYTIGDKTLTIFNDLLNYYSVSQLYSIIYSSTNKALRFKTEQGVSTKHAANTIIGYAQSLAERALLKGWEIQKYQRIKECPESALSKFFFERVLCIGYAGFNEKPSILMK